jgi:hypothetical protein
VGVGGDELGAERGLGGAGRQATWAMAALSRQA